MLSYLRKVGEAMSGYLLPGCLRPDWPVEVGLDLGEVDRPAASCSDTPTFSLSVWLMVMGLERPDPTFPPSLRFAPPAAPAPPPADFPLTLESMLDELERCPPLRPPTATPPLEDLAGRGRERYWRGTLAPPPPHSTPSSWGWEPSRLVLRPPPMPAPFPMAEALGTLPRVAEPLAREAPLEVIRVPEGPAIFL